MKNIFLITIVLSFSVMINSFAQSNPKVHPKFEIYLLLGQSNMAGRGPLTANYTEVSNENVLVWDKDSQWSIAKHPLHYDKPKAAGVGPGLSFGIAISKAHPKSIIGLVPCAVGGTSIHVWVPGAEDKATNTHPYDDAEVRIKDAMKYGVVKGMIWHQGESDSNPKNMEGYLDRLNELIARVRTLVGNKNLPVVVGELGRYKDAYNPFNTMIKDVPKFIPNVAVATSEDLKDKGDLTHFDSASATIYGKRFAEKMLLLQGKKSKNNSF